MTDFKDMEICNSTSREPKIAILRKFDELQKNTDNSTSQENNTGKNWEVSQGETQILELNNSEWNEKCDKSISNKTVQAEEECEK